MTIQNEEIAKLWRKEKKVWDKKDVDGIFKALEGCQGYGFRNLAWRLSSKATPEQVHFVEKWLESMEYLRHVDSDLNTWSEDDLGLAWGSYIEEFKHKGQPPEKVHIRFTSTYKKCGDTWYLVMYHKDAQPFNEDGSYIK